MKNKPHHSTYNILIVFLLIFTSTLLAGCEFTITKQDTFISISGPSEVMQGEEISVSVQVTNPDDLIPQGEVDIYILNMPLLPSPQPSDIDPNTPNCLGLPLNEEGKATCTLSTGSLETGFNTIYAQYKGNALFRESSATKSFEITPAPEPLTIPTVEILSVVEGSWPPSICENKGSAHITVRVTGDAPTGQVRIYMNGIDMHRGGILSGDSDVQTFEETTCLYEVGEITTVAKYLGDENNESAESAPVIFTSYLPSWLYITVPDPLGGLIDIHNPVEFTVHVYGEGGVPTGEVTISNADSSCTATVTTQITPLEFPTHFDVGEASCSLTFSELRIDDVVTATYSGDGTYNSSTTSSTYNLEGYYETTTLITGVFPNPPVHNQNVDVIVSVQYWPLTTGGILDQFPLAVPVKTNILTLFMSENLIKPLVPGPMDVPEGFVQITGADSNCSFYLPNDRCSVRFDAQGTYTLTATYYGASSGFTYYDSQDTLVVEVSPPPPPTPTKDPTLGE